MSEKYSKLREKMTTEQRTESKRLAEGMSGVDDYEFAQYPKPEQVVTERVTDTPRTDALISVLKDGSVPIASALVVHARQLERELAEARAKLREAMKYVDHYSTCPMHEYIWTSWPAGKPAPKCTCGLDALRIEEEGNAV